MTSPFDEPLLKKKRKKGPDDEIIKNVVVLKSSQVREKDGVVLMPKTTLDMSEIKKLGQSRKITFTKSTSSGDLQRKLEEKFPFLKEASGRFYCAKAVENRSKLDFCGDRCVWSGAFINKNITGNSALYIYCEEEKEGDSGHYSSDPDLPGAPVYGNCLVTAAPQGRKRFGSEPCPAAEGPHVIDKETLRAVESQTCGTVRESDRNYRPFGQPEGVKTQVIKKEASACALTVGREAAEEEQIQDKNPNTWLLTLQPTLLLSDLLEQTNPSTLAPLLESLQVSCKDIEIQKSYDQASTETFTAKGSQSAQQNTPVTVGDSNNQITEEIASLQNEIYDGSISLADNDFPPQNLRDLESIKQWLKQYDVSINPRESPLQGGGPCIFTFKPELPSDVGVKASFGNLEPIILEKTSLGYICKIPASPKMTPEVIPVRLISMTTGEILAETSLEYCGVLYVRKNFGGKPGACGSGRREDGSSDGGASGGGASGGRSSGGRSSGEGASGSGVSGDGTGGTGAGGCGGKGCGTYGGGATGCQYRIDASQLGSDVVSKLCDLMQKCSVGIQRQEPSATQNKACTEAEEGSEDDQLSCTQESNENYFADTEDCSSVSSETDSALSDSESWDESLRDSPLSFPWVNSRSSKSQEAILETESTQHSREAVYSKLNVSHEIQELMTEEFTSEDSIGNNNYVGSGVCHKWNTSLPESKKTEENCEKDDHNKMQDSSQEWAFFSEGRTSHIQLASHDDTPVLCLDALDLIVENEESQYQDNELFEAPHAENAKPKDSESVLSVTSNQQSATHAGPTTQSQAPQSPVSIPLWNGDSKLNMAPPQCSDEEVHSGQEWEESGEGLASWFDLCENENAGKNERSRWEMSSIEPNKTGGGVEKDVFDSEEDLSQEQGLFSEQGNSHVHLSLPDDTSVQSRRPEVENEEIQGTPLCEAAENGHTDIVRLLIENGADVNKEGWDTPLSGAARNGHTDIVRLLIENGADVNKGEWFTPLCEAAENGHTYIVRLLIENRADVNERELILMNTPLCKAAGNGHTDIVRLLIENGADVNKEGWGTPLCKAAENGHTDIVRLLIKNGAEVNKSESILGRTPLTEAVKNDHTDIARLLIENGADVNKGIWDTLLLKAARNGDTDILRLLIENGADINKEGWDTPLCMAAGNGHTDIVKLLTENGADVNKGGRATPLFEAVKSGRTDIVKLLIKNGADINIKGLLGLNPLVVLVDNGADFNVATLDTKLSLERELDVQLRGKKTASLPKRPGKRLKTQTEITSPRDIVEEDKYGKDSITDVELGLNCLHLSPRCEELNYFKISQNSIIYHDLKPINKRMDRVTLTDVCKAKQDHCVVVEIAKTHPCGDTIIIYGREINEEGSGMGDAFRLANKDPKGTWEDEEIIAENVQIGSVVKYVQVGDEFLFQGNTKRPRWDMERIFLDLSSTDGSDRSIGDAFPSSKLLAVDSCQDCTPKEISYFSRLKCDVVENDRISVITKFEELLHPKLNCREDVILPVTPSIVELSHVEVNKDVVDDAVVETREPLLISGFDGLRDEPKETSVEAEKPEADLEEKDDEDGNAF